MRKRSPFNLIWRYIIRLLSRYIQYIRNISVTTPWVFSQDIGFNSTLDFLKTWFYLLN